MTTHARTAAAFCFDETTTASGWARSTTKGESPSLDELTIQNQTDRFSPAIDVIDRIPVCSSRAPAFARRIAAAHAQEFGVHPQDVQLAVAILTILLEERTS
jgi:phosphoketolase